LKILVVGSGGREHTLLWKLSQSPKVSKLFCAPGNGGTREFAENIDIPVDDIEGLLSFALENKIHLTVVGPELPLSLGIADAFEEKGLRIFGPRKVAAQLESSKAFAKDFMRKYCIPTAQYRICHSAAEAMAAAESFGYPVVLKADGLAAGKGVIIAEDKGHADSTIKEMMEGKFGSAGETIVVEEFLTGPEASVLAFVDGKTAVPMVSAQDYKRALDGDAGLNTGGMGAVSPALYYNDDIAQRVQREIIDVTLEGLLAEGIEYKGVLYFGLMLTKGGPKVIEYNARFGDPEAEVVLPRLTSDLVEIMDMVVEGQLDSDQIKWTQKKAHCSVIASGGYPGEYSKGYEITGLSEVPEDIRVFHAGTASKEGKIVTAGGRVLVVAALGDNLEKARQKVYSAIEHIHFKDMHYRTDIGKH
jgi:phosphoribosylamine--glycine ligase